MPSRRNAARERARRKKVYVGVALVVAVAAGVALVVTAGGSDDGTAAPQTHPVTVTGAVLPRYDRLAARDPAVGRESPSLAGTTLAGQPRRVVDDGRAKAIVFAAHWCPHCRREVPRLVDEMRARPLPANVELVMISTDANPNAENYPPSAWLDREQWPGPVLADDDRNSAAEAFGVTGYPFFVFVDTANRVVARASGGIPMEHFRAAVDAVAP
jgi:thiol-disulfide isomerase/thioredoxin